MSLNELLQTLSLEDIEFLKEEKLKMEGEIPSIKIDELIQIYKNLIFIKKDIENE